MGTRFFHLVIALAMLSILMSPVCRTPSPEITIISPADGATENTWHQHLWVTS